MTAGSGEIDLLAVSWTASSRSAPGVRIVSLDCSFLFNNGKHIVLVGCQVVAVLPASRHIDGTRQSGRGNATLDSLVDIY